MVTKKKLIKVVPYSEIVGTSWYDGLVYSSLNHLLKVLNLSFFNVDVYSLTDKTRYNLYLKVDGMPAFTIYDRCSFKYGVKECGEEDFVIPWHIGTFSAELSYKVCKYLSSLGLDVFTFDNTCHCKSSCNVDDFVVDDLPF